MQNIFEQLQADTKKWRESGYETEKFPAISEILSWNKDENGQLRYLREAQFNALEVYWYVRLVLKTPKLLELYKNYFPKNSDLLTALGVQKTEVITNMLIDGEDPFEKIKTDTKFAKSLQLDSLHESMNLPYASYILALAMGAGKTVLIGSIIATEFSMSIEYPEENFMKNALVFAPGTTIIESLREISDMPFEKILPQRFYKSFMANVKMVYTRNGEKSIPVQDNSTYNLIVTNTEKIALKKIAKRKGQTQIEFEELKKQEKLLSNARLNKISSLSRLGIFSDEAHHTYGNKLGDELKRVRSTINHLHDETNLVCVVNTTGTPYYKKQAIKDVIFWYSLQQGIQDNILKSLHNGIIAYDFKDEKPEEVIDDIIKDFFSKYGKTKLANGAMAKIAFYFASQEHLDSSKPLIEKALAKNKQNTTIILTNTQKSTQKEIDEFNRLNDPENQKRIILLIGKGTEGWNCPSLFATALIRELTSSNNFILQASTRCLRQIPENKQTATVYIEAKNQRTLDKELKETFALSLSELNKVEQKTEAQILEIKKTSYPALEITRTINKIVQNKKKNNEIKLRKPQKKQDNSIIKSIFEPKLESTGTIISPTGDENEIIFSTETYDLYTATQKIAQNYHLDYLPLLKELKKIYSENEIPRYHLQELFSQVEAQTQNYKTIEEKITEALALIKFQDEEQKPVFDKNEQGVYCHTIRYKKGTFGDNNELLVHTKDFAGINQKVLGFHYTPYNFDSAPEKDFFEKMLNKLQVKTKEIEDIYFTGGLTNTAQTDMYFQYKGIDGRYHNYFPDFVIVKKDGSFLIVEIKAEGKEEDLEVQAKVKAIKRLEAIPENRFKYEIIYTDSPIPVRKFENTDAWIKG